MSSSIGKNIRLSIFGASHGTAIGGVIDGLPAGEKVDLEALRRFMARRAPGRNALQTQRQEKDEVHFLAGLVEAQTSGSPLAYYINNGDHHSKDYANLRDIPRPSHADYTAILRYGEAVDMRGGGHFSGRLTAPLCVAGGIALQLLKKRGILIGAHLKQVGAIQDAPLDKANPNMEAFEALQEKEIPMLSEAASEATKTMLTEVRAAGDSVGAIIEAVATGIPGGLGNPIFDGLENRLAQMLFGIPGVKGVSFGSGFAGCLERGSEQNDPFYMVGDKIVTAKNNSGGIQGGITNGMPIVLQVGMKPTPSIAQKQDSVSLSAGENRELEIVGRHDPCIALRAVPVVEAALAYIILDFLEEK